MHLTSQRRLDDGVLESTFTLDGVPGLLWTPGPDALAAPLILVGHPGGLDRMGPRLARRARASVAAGFTAAALELPGAGGRDPLPDLDRARADLRRALDRGAPVQDIVERLVPPLVERAVPELRAALDVLLDLPGVRGPAGYSGGVVSVGLGLALAEPRIRAALLFAGTRVPRALLARAREITISLQVLLQWDDEGNDRRASLELFDALGSAEKTLHANTGGHTGVPAFEDEAGNRFFARHLK